MGCVSWASSLAFQHYVMLGHSTFIVANSLQMLELLGCCILDMRRLSEAIRDNKLDCHAFKLAL